MDVFNKGGAIRGIFDLAVAADENLVGPSFRGESTDRVIQWTYWNGRYKVPENPVGDKDSRANATMEGSPMHLVRETQNLRKSAYP